MRKRSGSSSWAMRSAVCGGSTKYMAILYGDGLLCYVAKELKEIVGGTVARVYGGEFCVLLDGKITPEEAAARAALVPISSGRRGL